MIFKKTTLFLILASMTVVVFAQQKSAATLRLESYDVNGCNVTVPNNPEWNVTYDLFRLQGDLAPNSNFVRRDPSSVLKVDGKYFVWYTYSPVNISGKLAPWDLSDLYYASSDDGITWTEHGVAVARGPQGSQDHRSAFTTEVFYHEGTFYLIYQAAADTQGIFGRNTIAMAQSNSPNGPWTKLNNPILSPTISNTPVFDSNAVHDPCLIQFNGKFHLYYKGEGNEANICGLGVWNQDKQVKWGVATSDNPTGPFVKSELNPVTNTGHEVCIWKSGDGIAAMLHQDGPEFATLQYAADGLNFNIMGEVGEFIRLQPKNTDYPEAAGLYRPVSDEKSPVSGVSWGISHVLEDRNWMSLRRFENIDKSVIVNDIDNPGIQLSQLSTDNFDAFSNSFKIYPNPVKNSINIDIDESGTLKFEIISVDGRIIKTGNFENSINVAEIEEGFYILRVTNLSNNSTFNKSFIKGIN